MPLYCWADAYKRNSTLQWHRIFGFFEAILRQQVEDAIEEKTEELKNRPFDRLLGGDDDETTDETTDEESAEEDPEKELQRKLLEKLIGD